MTTWDQLNCRIQDCEACPRLRRHCLQVAAVRRRAFAAETYWGKPVPNFGDPGARLLVVGLAPGAHGANRTGRMFTGDRSGDWLYRALHRAGFASQPKSIHRDDGMQLYDCAITGICHCAPPGNRPTTTEIANCSGWLADTIDLLPVHVFLALGQLAWRGIVEQLVARGEWKGPRPQFAHGARRKLRGHRWLLASYHPSQQNTFTGRLTETMLDDVMAVVRELLRKE